MAEVYPEYNEEYDEYIDDSSSSIDPYKATSQYHTQQAEMAIQNLKYIVREPGWKKILQHKSGASIYNKLGVTDIPVYMGEHVIEGFTPRAIFAVIGMRKLWDDWYEEGNLVENLNDTTSLTYMAMQALAGSKARDLALVEKIDCAQNGTIYFAATSIETPKIPRVPNRIRAHLNLNGWILEPLSYNPARTRVTYVLQTVIKGWVPSIVSKTYLARRPLILYTIDQYLQKNGPLPMVIGATPPDSNSLSRAQSESGTSSTYQDNTLKDNNTDLAKFKSQRMKISFTDLSESSAKRYDDVTSPSKARRVKSSFFPRKEKPTNASMPSLKFPTSSKSLTSPKSPASPISPTIPMSPTFTSPVSGNSSLSKQRSFVKPIQHRHTASVQRALEIFKSYIPPDGWDLYSENKGVKIYMKEIPGKSTPILRGEAVIFGGFTTYDILSVVKNLDTRRLWDERYEEGATYETFGLHEQLVRTAMKGIFPISGRDFSTCSMLDHDENTGTLLFVATSVVDPLIPESKKHVRGHVESVGWQLKPNKDSNGKTISVKVVYIVDMDIKLDTVPSSIRKTLSVQIPMIVSKIDELMQKKGFSPYVLNSNIKIIKEEFNVKNDQYDISLIAKDGGVTELKLSKLMYLNGVEVNTIPENCKVELLPNSTDSVRITLPSRVDLDTLNITISKHSKGFKMTYNHGQIIPDASNSKIEEPAEITQNISTRSKHPRHSINVTTSTNSTLVANGAIQNHVTNNRRGSVINNDKSSGVRPSRKHKTLSSKNIITSKLFVNPSEVSLKSEPYQRLLEKKTLLENKIEAITRASHENLALLEVKSKTTEFQASHENLEHLEVKPKTTEFQASHENLAHLEVKPKTTEFRASKNLAHLEVKPRTTEFRASHENLAHLEVKPRTAEFRASHENLAPLKVKSKTEEFRASHENLAFLEVKPRTAEFRALNDDLAPSEVEKPKNEVIENNTNDTNILNNTQNMVAITDSIRFSSHQVGIMFASMLLAYYAGKLSNQQ